MHVHWNIPLQLHANSSFGTSRAPTWHSNLIDVAREDMQTVRDTMESRTMTGFFQGFASVILIIKSIDFEGYLQYQEGVCWLPSMIQEDWYTSSTPSTNKSNGEQMHETKYLLLEDTASSRTRYLPWNHSFGSTSNCDLMVSHGCGCLWSTFPTNIHYHRWSNMSFKSHSFLTVMEGIMYCLDFRPFSHTSSYLATRSNITDGLPVYHSDNLAEFSPLRTFCEI